MSECPSNSRRLWTSTSRSTKCVANECRSVCPVTPALFKLADNPHAMMRVPVAEIQAIIRPCGLSPKKAAAISGLSKILVEQHGGEVPADFTALEALPS